jgi:hypothetical protein
MIKHLSRFVATTLVFAAIGCGGAAKLKAPMPENDSRAYRECQTDAQCAYVLNGCCDCVNGGNDFAVASSQLDAFREKFECDQGCTEMGGDCGRGTVACEQGLCVYRAPASNGTN